MVLEDFTRFLLPSSRRPPAGGRLAGPVRRLPAHHGAGERRDQPGAAGARMVQSEVLSLSDALCADVLIKVTSCPPAAGGVAKLHR